MERLIKWFEAERGRKSRMTEALNLSPGAISQWKRVPRWHVRAISKMTKISMRALRPDLPQSAFSEKE